ncbi:hypothetical protein [Methanolobus chelungpuianus]|uniref:DUF8147 domain-containing protein n=1 Tax=Methanolobus chelungpuianus TaxID=502115 RepID=A0AAE3HBD7_9EURY|nr:hypothetical protein [Methanolobus chelungpuianus]MCQ6963145.1 hypothetical protein [Methanolobus chelungpuianus]
MIVIFTRMGLLKKFLLSTAVSILIAVTVTALLEDRIFFSAFLGIPAGIVTFIASFAYLSSKEMNERP